MADVRRIFGNRGEALAASYLEEKGFVILERQYRTPFGEIDLIARDHEEIVFIEVKTRHSKTYGYPEEAVTREKVRHILRTAESYLGQHQKEDHPWRVDVVAIEMHPGAHPVITHFSAIDMPSGW